MSGKNFIETFPVIVNGDMSANITSTFTTILKEDNVLYQAVWSGAALVGNFVVEVTNDNPANLNHTPTWTALTFDFSTAVPADSGNGVFNITNCPSQWIRFRYAATSGTGTLNVKVVAKGLG